MTSLISGVASLAVPLRLDSAATGGPSRSMTVSRLIGLSKPALGMALLSRLPSNR